MSILRNLRSRNKVQENPKEGEKEEEEEEEAAKAQAEEEEKDGSVEEEEGAKAEEEEEGEEEQEAGQDEEEETEAAKAQAVVNKAIIRERKRIQALDDLSASYTVDRKMIYDAKFVKGWGVARFIEEQSKANKKAGRNIRKSLDEDSERIERLDSTSNKSSSREALDKYAIEHARTLNKTRGSL